MATILFSAAGAAIGGSIGGTVAGLSSVAIGRAVGATLGQVIDQRLLGQGGEPVETGKIDRFRLSSAGEGDPIPQVFGRTRVGGQVIWASDFRESSTTTGGGKGGPSSPEVTTFSYSVSLAIAICTGEIATIGRVWADGEEVSRNDVNLQIYTGSKTQLPDPAMEAIEGQGNVPAYRGTAYVVLEDLSLQKFGNRVPQFSFEVLRAEQHWSSTFEGDLPQLVQGVALMPGTGEYALASSPVYYTKGPGTSWSANVNSPSGKSDFKTSFEQLQEELPNCDAASLVVSWFGSDLRCGECSLKPKIERREFEGRNMPWKVSGVSRSDATEIVRNNDQPIYGGTPSDASVVQAIRHMNESGQRVMFYPFILMEQTKDNGLLDPWTGQADQPVLPWRGRITLSLAPGAEKSPDRTEQASAEVQAFFGRASASDFVVRDGSVLYNGPVEWGLRRFILHYAALCAAAGGVASFCISSEMRGLTQIRDVDGFPAVDSLRDLAAEVRTLLGPDTKIGYAADWSEYFGFQPNDGSGDRFFHLDSLWADANIDFVGIDNYMPLSDWREDEDHADSAWKSIYNPDYLQSNIEGGEGYDWYYSSSEAEERQIRSPIEDGEFDEPWIWRYKDLRNWWTSEHHERISGVRQANATAWVPQSKPIWFTELGSAAIDKGTNQPNKFIDAKSSESSLPKYSNGSRDDLIQLHYLQAILGYWKQSKKNPLSEVYGGKMIDMSNAYVWAWDMRPFPAFPNNNQLWEDGTNYPRGHWINGRVGARSLSSVVEEVCHLAGLSHIDTSGLYGVVRGYSLDQIADARSALQPLMLRFGFDAIERNGVLRFQMRDGRNSRRVSLGSLADSPDVDGLIQHDRAAEAEMVGRVRVRFVQSGSDYGVVSEEAVMADSNTQSVTGNDLALSMTRAEGRQVAERWLAEARVSRDTVRFALPPSQLDFGAGDIVELNTGRGEQRSTFRIDRVEHSGLQVLDAVRIEAEVYRPSEFPDDEIVGSSFVPPVPVFPLFMDLPLMSGDEKPHAPHLAVTSQPWPGTVALFSSVTDDSYAISDLLTRRAVVGRTESSMRFASPGIWDIGSSLQVSLFSGSLESRSEDAILNGANLAAIGDGTSGNWELFQFANSELIGKDTFLLSGRLRGQLGSDGNMPKTWPVGSWFVLMNEATQQITLKPSQRRIARNYRIGPAERGYDDSSFTHVVEAFDGNGLRPYSPCHLSFEATDEMGISVHWVRRTRTDGDTWDNPEVPLGEEREAYSVRVKHAKTIVRETTVYETSWLYSASMQLQDGISECFQVEIAQISALYGVGVFSRLKVDLSL